MEAESHPSSSLESQSEEDGEEGVEFWFSRLKRLPNESRITM